MRYPKGHVLKKNKLYHIPGNPGILTPYQNGWIDGGGGVIVAKQYFPPLLHGFHNHFGFGPQLIEPDFDLLIQAHAALDEMWSIMDHAFHVTPVLWFHFQQAQLALATEDFQGVELHHFFFLRSIGAL
jgi:hypothetical protein